MSIKKTKEQIATLKWAHFVDQNDGTRSLEVEELKALAASHTELLDLALRVKEHLYCGLDDDALAPVVDEAIRRAEGDDSFSALEVTRRKLRILLEAAKAMTAAWAESWDCSRDPGHELMEPAQNRLVDAVKQAEGE